MATITADQVKAEVQRFWSVFCSKSHEGLAEFYAPEASVFGSSATRPEPGRLAAARRQREYFNKQTTIRAQVGSVDVQILSDRLALAAYTFSFHASRVAVGIAKSQEEDISNGRATQLFQLEHDGRLLIVHEHLSAVEKT